uniref:Uncharacterized protein n=1 Tax=Pseudomonas putida TaxID=303 RepID=Q8VML9_PSEPU|nr:hypothetical protein [Pseudomonas putida]
MRIQGRSSWSPKAAFALQHVAPPKSSRERAPTRARANVRLSTGQARFIAWPVVNRRAISSVMHSLCRELLQRPACWPV